jgi:hypothetical protein
MGADLLEQKAATRPPLRAVTLLFLRRLPDHPDPEGALERLTDIVKSVVNAPSGVEALGATRPPLSERRSDWRDRSKLGDFVLQNVSVITVGAGLAPYALAKSNGGASGSSPLARPAGEG